MTSLQSALKPLRTVGKSSTMAIDAFVSLAMPSCTLRKLVIQMLTTAALTASYTRLAVAPAPEGVDTAVINVLTTLQLRKSRKRRSALVHSGSWAGHLRFVRQTRLHGGTLNSMSPVSKRSDV